MLRYDTCRSGAGTRSPVATASVSQPIGAAPAPMSSPCTVTSSCSASIGKVLLRTTIFTRSTRASTSLASGSPTSPASSAASTRRRCK